MPPPAGSEEQQQPSITVIQPLSKKINFRSETYQALLAQGEKAAALLQKHYTSALSDRLLQSYTDCLSMDNAPAGYETVIIHVSTTCSKTVFVDFLLKEEIAIGKPLVLRKVMLGATQRLPFLLLLLAPKGNQFYIGSLAERYLQPIAKGGKTVDGFANDAPERVANFSDLHERKHQVIIKFLRYTDKKLGDLAHEHDLPVIVMGSPRLLGHFKSLTKHSRRIIGYIQGSFQRLSLNELLYQLGEHLDFRQIHYRQILDMLAEQKDRGNVSAGVANVWNRLTDGRGKILVVEENFHFSDSGTAAGGVPASTTDGPDIVDDLIEMAIRKHCRVEFVADSLLQEEQHIALIEYY